MHEHRLATRSTRDRCKRGNRDANRACGARSLGQVILLIGKRPGQNYSEVVAELHDLTFVLLRKSFYCFIKHHLLRQRPCTIGLTAVSLDAAGNVDPCAVVVVASGVVCQVVKSWLVKALMAYALQKCALQFQQNLQA
jgi:hypothetical protein